MSNPKGFDSPLPFSFVVASGRFLFIPLTTYKRSIEHFVTETATKSPLRTPRFCPHPLQDYFQGGA
jgi:hypothetical protein